MKKSTSKYHLHKPIFDMLSETYHSIEGTYSSSQFKDLLDDEEIFIKKYVEKSVPREHVPAFDVGTYFHTGILEPHKLTTECVVFDGKIRRGKEWDKFLAENTGKVIMTSAQMEQAERLMSSVRDSPVAMNYVKRGKPEVSLFTELIVIGGEIIAPKFSKILTKNGWQDVSDWARPKLMKNAVSLVIKVRADSLGEDFILDLKSTTGNARSYGSMRQKISYYQYDLSAALYLDMFSLIQGPMDTFIWTFASKDFFNSRSYKASEDNIKVGRAKYMRAIFKLAECQRNDWQLYDYLGELEPLPHELEHLREKETDLI